MWRHYSRPTDLLFYNSDESRPGIEVLTVFIHQPPVLEHFFRLPGRCRVRCSLRGNGFRSGHLYNTAQTLNTQQQREKRRAYDKIKVTK